MSYRALVVSTWGDFRRYQPAYYVHEGGGAGVKCNSSSIALTQILSARGHDVKALVILPYTLLGPEDIGNAGSIDYPVVVDRVVGKAREQVKQWVGSGDCEAGDALTALSSPWSQPWPR
ncbi:hypothetical protein [Vulcanisaeta sp. JCM 14467]|uniref:hypothetical protein n=1 Tax=Vulcanisaeta sp. JCM 14467 TaxID=1295370 RepID=UPI0006CF8C86|nr:hypothetical protein [Vulcanisaeta sp. JCM 14467]